MAFKKTDYMRQYQANAAARDRDISIRRCADPARRARCLADPVLFLKTYYEEKFFRPFSEDQKEAIHTIVQCAENGSDELICAPRGDWKTETTKHMLIYLISKQLVRFPVFINATAGAGSISYEHVKKEFIAEMYAADFPEIADPVLALKGSSGKAKLQTYKGRSTELVWGAEHVSFAVIQEVPGTGQPYWTPLQEIPGTGKPSPFGGVKLTFRGLESHIRGINIESDRPDFALGDDLETRESANSDSQIEAREQVLDNDVGGLAGGDEEIPRVMIGTIQNQKCLTNKKLKEWGGKRYQAVKKWPDDEQSIKLRDEFIEMWRDERRKGDKLHTKSYDYYLENQDRIEFRAKLANPHNKSRKFRSDGRPRHISAFHRICLLAASKGWSYVQTELQNDPPKEKDIQTMGLTYSKVMSRISGIRQKEVPPDTQCVCATMDLGKYQCHWEIKAWQAGMAAPTINYGIAEVKGIGTQSDQAHVDMAIRRTLHQWREELMSGKLSDAIPDNVLIDSGTPIQGRGQSGGSKKDGEHADVVYNFIKEIQDGTSTFKASKGLSPYGVYEDIPDKRIAGNHWHANLQKDKGIWLYNLDTDWLKLMVHQMWLTPTFDDNVQFNPLSMSLFSAVDRHGRPDTRRHLIYSNHQVAEEYRKEFVEGKGMRKWWHPLNPNNHWFDTSYMNLAAAIMMGMWFPMSSDDPPPDQVEEAEPATKPRPERNHDQFSHRGEPFLAQR